MKPVGNSIEITTAISMVEVQMYSKNGEMQKEDRKWLNTFGE